jgi:hypothetical protein
MSGTISGGKQAAKTNKERYGEDFYARIGEKANASWVANGKKPRGFSVMSPEARRAAGSKGGKISKRKPNE